MFIIIFLTIYVHSIINLKSILFILFFILKNQINPLPPHILSPSSPSIYISFSLYKLSNIEQARSQISTSKYIPVQFYPNKKKKSLFYSFHVTTTIQHLIFFNLKKKIKKKSTTLKFTYPTQHRAQTKVKGTYLTYPCSILKNLNLSKLPWSLFNCNSSKAQLFPHAMIG